MALRQKARASDHARRELYPAIAFVLVMAAQPVLYLVGVSSRTAAYGIVFSVSAILSVWAMQRKVRRTAHGL